MKTVKLIPIVSKEAIERVNLLMTQLQHGHSSNGIRIKLRRVIAGCIDEAYTLGKGLPREEEQRDEIIFQPLFDSEADKMRYGQLYKAVETLAYCLDEPVESTECRLAQYLKSRGVCSL